MEKIHITVWPQKEKKKQGDLFGIFFEDLNHAADGGLYGEMVRNRSFEFCGADREGYHGLTAWEVVERGNSVVQAHVESAAPVNDRNEHYLVLEVMTCGEGGGIRNEGYNAGLSVERGKEYKFSCFCRVRTGKKVPFRVRLEDASGWRCYAEEILHANEGKWEKLECRFFSTHTDHGARLALLSETPVCLELDMVSLFPAETFGNRENGLRRDIAEMLADMKPGFMRFPGGCLIHIGSLDARDRCGMYRWKNTIGPVEKRPARRNTWNYNQTLGLGFYELFQFCEDIGAKALPVISAGYDPHYLRMAPLDGMQEWIDEALDLIEFANGSVNTKWGALRAQMGHPESFHLEYLGIGNEEVGKEFFERYEIILNAVKEKYPEIRVIGSAGPGSAGSEFELGWEQARRTGTALVDEHFYQCPEWFIANAHRYENYAPHPKAFLGEYASQDDMWGNALVEAAFMIGMEKAEGAGLACYAPLLNNVDYSNWKPTLLYCDNYRVYGSPSYYVQKLFMNYMGESLVEACTERAVRGTDRKPVLTGQCRMWTDHARVEIADMAVWNDDTGECVRTADFFLSEQEHEKKLPPITWENYSVTFRFCKKNGGTAENLEGRCSFRLDFAMEDEENRLYFQIDGWQRLASLGGVFHGKNCDMGLYHFITETEKFYECKVTVEKGRISAVIDGIFCGNHVCRMPAPDEIYYSAVKDREGNLVVKLANLTETEKEITVDLQETKKYVEVISMSGFALTDRNSFEEPQRVVPKREAFSLEDSQYRYFIKAHSLAVLRFMNS